MFDSHHSILSRVAQVQCMSKWRLTVNYVAPITSAQADCIAHARARFTKVSNYGVDQRKNVHSLPAEFKVLW